MNRSKGSRLVANMEPLEVSNPFCLISPQKCNSDLIATEKSSDYGLIDKCNSNAKAVARRQPVKKTLRNLTK